MTMSRNPLRRSRRRRVLAGVCGGFADWLGWDPTLVRILYVGGNGKGPSRGPFGDGVRRLPVLYGWPPTTPPASSIILSEMIPIRSTPAALARSIACTTRP